MLNNVTEMVLNTTSLNLQSNDLVTTGDLSLGASPASAGDMRVNTGFSMQGRNAGDTSDAILQSWSSAIYELGSNDADLTEVRLSVGSGGQHNSYIAGTVRWSLGAAAGTYSVAIFGFANTVPSPIFRQNTDTGASATGDLMTINAQDVTGSGTTITGGALTVRAGDAEGGTATNRQGGALILAGGTGGTGSGDSGSIELRSGATVGFKYQRPADVAQMAFFGGTPVIQQAGTGETVGFTAGGGTTVTDASTFTGNVGATAYRISDVVKALKNYGLLAA
jgi:hypothetical protein